MAYDPKKDPAAQKLSEWIITAQREGLHERDVGWNPAKGDLIKAWLDQGKREGILALVGVPSPEQLEILERRFKQVRLWLLAVLIGGAATVGFGITTFHLAPPFLATTAGLVGSATAALISCLDRRANGFEAPDGAAFPDPATKKERFGLGMAEWLMTRPALGLFMGWLAYFGISGNVLRPQTMSVTLEAMIFWAAVAGLFAKTLYDLLLGFLKALVPSKGR
jgi:hypothetical protein